MSRIKRILKSPVKRFKSTADSARVARKLRAHANVNPPNKWYRRWLWYMNPKRFTDFWFTHEGKITALKIAGVSAGLLFISIAGLFLFFAKDLPSPGKVNSLGLAQTTRFYDRTGQKLLYEVYGDKNRTVVDLNDMNDNIKHATIAIEDKDFYNHGAFSSFGILRAAVNNVFKSSDTIQGGSTITQQYVKNALLSPERTFSRKIKELILSIQIEQLYSKDDILELYLNEIPYGTLAYGVQAASKTYFSKPAKDLTIDEAAMLAALPRAPSYYSPYGANTEDLKNRRDLVITQMQEQGYITADQAKTAKATDTLAKVNNTPNLYRDMTAPHFVLHAQSVLEEKLGNKQVTEGGLKVITTLDLDKQAKAEEAVKNGIGVVDRAGGNNIALVAGDPKNGQVLAMVGSRDFNYPEFGTFNAALARRQPGSSFKPYVYATGFKTNNWGPGSVMYDVRTDFGGYVPNNYDNRFHGQMTIRSAINNSFNIPAVKMLYIVGLQAALDTAHSMGITTLQNPSDFGLSLVLGAGEIKLADHVNAYQSFANGGMHYPQTPILKVTNPQGKTLIDNSNPKGKRVLDPQVSYLINNILSDDSTRTTTFGRNNPDMNIPGHVTAVKTGTTDKNKDGWMIGYSPDLVTGVWVGHTQNRSMSGITSRLTGTTWAAFMKKALEGVPNKQFDKPAGIKQVTLDSFTGKMPGPNTRVRHTDVFPSWYTAKPPAGSQTVVIDKVSNKIATACTPEAAKQTVTGQGLEAEIPPSDPAFARWNPPVQQLGATLGLGIGGGGNVPAGSATDDLHKCTDVKPTVSLTAQTSGNTIQITTSVSSGTHIANKLEIKYNGQVINSPAINGSGTFVTTYTPTATGNYTFTAEVTDAALYSGAATVSIDYTQAPTTLRRIQNMPVFQELFNLFALF